MNEQLDGMKRAIEDIEVPEQKLNEAIAGGIGRARTQKKRRKAGPLLAVAAAVFLTVSSAYVSPAMARALSGVPVLDSVFEFTGDLGLKIASERGLVQGIGQTVSDQGIGLTVEDVYYDGTRLSISYVHEYEDAEQMAALEYPEHLGELQLFVDGKEINFSDSRRLQALSDTQYAGVINVMPVGSLPDSFELQMKLRFIGDVPGEWDFKFPVELAAEDLKTVTSGKTMTYKDSSFTVKDIKFGPAGTKLSLTLSAPYADALQTVDGQLMQFHLLDDDGQALTMLDSFGTGEIRKEDGMHVMDWEYRYDPLPADTKSVTVAPYLVPVDTREPVRMEQPLDPNEFPLTIDQGEMGSVIVHDLREEDDHLVLTFESDSDFPFDGHFQHHTLWLQNADGQDLTVSIPERIRPNVYEQKFKKADGPLTLVTFEMETLKLLQDAEVVVPLD